MKDKIIVTETIEDLNCLKENQYVKDYGIIAADSSNELSEEQISNINENTNINEIIMLFGSHQQQQTFFHKYKDSFHKISFGFVHYLNGESIKFTLDYNGQDFIKELLKNRVSTPIN